MGRPPVGAGGQQCPRAGPSWPPSSRSYGFITCESSQLRRMVTPATVEKAPAREEVAVRNRPPRRPLYQLKAEFFKSLGHAGPDPGAGAAERARAGRRRAAARGRSRGGQPVPAARGAAAGRVWSPPGGRARRCTTGSRARRSRSCSPWPARSSPPCSPARPSCWPTCAPRLTRFEPDGGAPWTGRTGRARWARRSRRPCPTSTACPTGRSTPPPTSRSCARRSAVRCPNGRSTRGTWSRTWPPRPGPG